jgi:hypothetical protein
MRARPILVLLAALIAVTACADDTTSPTAVDRSAALAPKAPSFGLVSAGAFGESFDFPEATAIGQLSMSLANCGPGSLSPAWACVAPKPWRPTDFDVAIHLRDRSAWDAPEIFRAMHGTYCQPFSDATNVSETTDDYSHQASTYDDMNYRCRNHMMTAIKSSGYGAIFVTPNALVDFSNGEASIRWAMSTFRTSGQDWVDLWITPWEENLKLPLDGSLAGTDLQGPPRRAIHVRMTSGSRGTSAFQVFVVNNFVETQVVPSSGAGYETLFTPVSTRRDTFELKLSKTHVKFGMWKGDVHAGDPIFPKATVPFASMTWVDQSIPSLDWGAGVVQFGHHSLNPASDGGFGGTWHWDDFAIAPATPFTIIKSTNVEGASLPNDRYADSKHPDMQLASPMPATGARFVRFAAYGDKVRVSFGNGKWIDALPQPESPGVDGRFHSYFVAVPADVGSATTVSFKAKRDKLATEPTNEDDGVWRVRDVAIWVR